MFHGFHRPGERPGQGSLTADDLRELLDFIGTDHLLPAREWLRRALEGRSREGGLLAGDRCLTFDDGLRSQMDLAAPVLRERGLTAFWFIPTAPFCGQVEQTELFRAFRSGCFESMEAFYEAFSREVLLSDAAEEASDALARFHAPSYLPEYPFYSESDRRFRFLRDRVLGAGRYAGLMRRMMQAAGVSQEQIAAGLWMNADDLRRLHIEGHVIGLHSHTHPTNLAALDFAAQQREYRDNCTVLTQIVGQRPMAMSHPCNSYDGRTLEILRGLGIHVGFCSNTSRPAASWLELPREDHANLWREMQCGSPFLQATSRGTSR